jgi:hypothetical protein
MHTTFHPLEPARVISIGPNKLLIINVLNRIAVYRSGTKQIGKDAYFL